MAISEDYCKLVQISVPTTNACRLKMPRICRTLIFANFNEAGSVLLTVVGGGTLGGMGKRVGQAGHRSPSICDAANIAADTCGGVRLGCQKSGIDIPLAYPGFIPQKVNMFS